MVLTILPAGRGWWWRGSGGGGGGAGGELTSCFSRHGGPVSASAVWNELLGSALIAAVTRRSEFSFFFFFFFSSPRNVYFLLRLVSASATEALRGAPGGRRDGERRSINQNTGETSTCSSFLGVVYSSFPRPALSQ